MNILMKGCDIVKKILIIALTVVFLAGCSKSMPSSEFGALQTEYHTLQSDYVSLEDKFSKLQEDYDNLLSSVGDSPSDSAKDFTKILVDALKIDRKYISGFITDGFIQVNFLAIEEADDELAYFVDLLSSGYDALELWCKTKDVEYISLKVTDDDGAEMFELTYNFIDGADTVSTSIGVNYLDVISEELLNN